MPYYNNENINLLFIHIPKTGGSSIENYFSQKFNIPLNEKSLKSTCYPPRVDILPKNMPKRLKNISLQHYTYNNIFRFRRVFNINYNNLKIITAVRNPYERMVSDLFFLKLINVDSSKEKVYKSIKKHIVTNSDNHSLPQYRFIINFIKNRIPNLTIIKTETLTDDMHNLGYDDFNLYHNTNRYNKSKEENKETPKINYYDYLNQNSINLINSYYHYDFILFNYNKI